MRVVGIAIAALALLAGCGGGDATDDVAAVIARAVSTSEDAETFRVAVVADAGRGNQAFSMDAEGVSAADQSRGRFEGTIAIGGGPPEHVEFIAVDDTYYFRGERYDETLPAGKEWVRVKGDQPTTMTPAEFIGFLQQSDDIENAGTEDVRGRPATHLEGPLDFEELAKSTGPEAENYIASIPGVERFEAELDAWVDEKTGELVRMAIVMTAPGVDERIELRADVLEYDVPLDGTEAPDPSIVLEP
jgi:hypothetical protein